LPCVYGCCKKSISGTHLLIYERFDATVAGHLTKLLQILNEKILCEVKSNYEKLKINVKDEKDTSSRKMKQYLNLSRSLQLYSWIFQLLDWNIKYDIHVMCKSDFNSNKTAPKYWSKMLMYVTKIDNKFSKNEVVNGLSELLPCIDDCEKMLFAKKKTTQKADTN